MNDLSLEPGLQTSAALLVKRRGPCCSTGYRPVAGPGRGSGEVTAPGWVGDVPGGVWRGDPAGRGLPNDCAPCGIPEAEMAPMTSEDAGPMEGVQKGWAEPSERTGSARGSSFRSEDW